MLETRRLTSSADNSRVMTLMSRDENLCFIFYLAASVEGREAGEEV